MKKLLLALLFLSHFSFAQLYAPNGTTAATTNPLTGNVGIGTTTPLYKTVISNNGADGIEFDPAGGQLTGGVGIQAYNRSTSSYVPFQLWGSKVLLGGGNVGIGTTSPLYKT